MNKSFTLSLSEEDYLNYQLFTASQSSQIKSTRRKSIIGFCLAFFVLAIIFFIYTDDLILPLIYLLIAASAIFLFPLYQKGAYKRHFQKFIRENNKATIDKRNDIHFTEDSIDGENADIKTQIQYSLIEAINEVPNAFYLRLKSAQSIIIPKSQVGNVDEARNFLKNLATKINIVYNDFPDWEWK